MRIVFEVTDNAVTNLTLEYIGDRPANPKQAWDITLAKWKYLQHLFAKGHAVHDGGGSTCGLCMYYANSSGDCGQCPIATAGHAYCRGTPYGLFIHSRQRVGLDAATNDIDNEIAFLYQVRGNDPTGMLTEGRVKRLLGLLLQAPPTVREVTMEVLVNGPTVRAYDMAFLADKAIYYRYPVLRIVTEEPEENIVPEVIAEIERALREGW
jgi:hypothetical protein